MSRTSLGTPRAIKLTLHVPDAISICRSSRYHPRREQCAKPVGVINGPSHSAMIKDALLEIIRPRRKMSLAGDRLFCGAQRSQIYISLSATAAKRLCFGARRPPLIGRFQMYIRKRQFNRSVCECERARLLLELRVNAPGLLFSLAHAACV
jgi:hypothetical protein